MAADLRETVGALRIAIDLERIADLAENMAKRVLLLSGKDRFEQGLSQLEPLVELILSQLRCVLHSYGQHDSDEALAVWERDQEVDAMHELVFRELLTYMTQESRRIALWRRIALCTHLLFCAKNLERMGDHVTNVAESVYYIATRYQLTQARLGPLRPSLGEESRGRALAKAHQPRARR